MRAGVGLLVVLALLLGMPRRSSAQCALCRAAVESSEEGRAMARNLNRAILLLLGAPLGVGASVAAAMLRSRGRLARKTSPRRKTRTDQE